MVYLKSMGAKDETRNKIVRRQLIADS